MGSAGLGTPFEVFGRITRNDDPRRKSIDTKVLKKSAQAQAEFGRDWRGIPGRSLPPHLLDGAM